MTENADLSFDTPLSHEEVVERLTVACASWPETAERFDSLSAALGHPGTMLAGDNAAFVAEGKSLAVVRYVQERAWHAARTLRELHHLVFHTEPGKLSLRASVMYPWMRSVLEDSATLVWLRSPEDQNDRLSRILRIFVEEDRYYTKNQRLLGIALGGVADEASEYSQKLTTHMDAEKEKSEAHFRALAQLVGVDTSGAVHTRTPITVEYGPESVEFVTWKFLSDLSHFSFMMLRHMATSPVPGSDARLEHIALLQFSQTVNRVCDDAAVALERSAKPLD